MFVAIFVSAFLYLDLAATLLGAQPEPTIPVCVQREAAPLFLVTVAEFTASQIFSNVGVRLKWLDNCKRTPEGTILVRLLDEPISIPGVLGSSRPYEGIHIEIFLDRVLAVIEPKRQPALLGHVMAHEIAHLLEGVSRHSDAGVLKEHWDASDYKLMAWKPLSFTPLDIKLIHQGVEQRATRIASRN